jgi:hypothetical protein
VVGLSLGFDAVLVLYLRSNAPLVLNFTFASLFFLAPDSILQALAGLLALIPDTEILLDQLS